MAPLLDDILTAALPEAIRSGDLSLAKLCYNTICSHEYGVDRLLWYLPMYALSECWYLYGTACKATPETVWTVLSILVQAPKAKDVYVAAFYGDFAGVLPEDLVGHPEAVAMYKVSEIAESPEAMRDLYSQFDRSDLSDLTLEVMSKFESELGSPVSIRRAFVTAGMLFFMRRQPSRDDVRNVLKGVGVDTRVRARKAFPARALVTEQVLTAAAGKLDLHPELITAVFELFVRSALPVDKLILDEPACLASRWFIPILRVLKKDIEDSLKYDEILNQGESLKGFWENRVWPAIEQSIPNQD